MNTGYFRKDKIYKDVGGVITQIFDFASQPSITPAQLALATGMSLTRATELVNERTVFNSTNCPLSSVSNINFVSATYSVVEPDSGVSVVDVVLRRTNGCDGSITVTIDRIGGTASPVNDFINIFPLTQTWLDQDCTDKTIQVSIVGDTINEPGVAETIILEISNPIGNGVIGTLNQTTISITDNDLAYIVNTQVSSTSNCLATGSVTYPISSNVLGGSNYNVPVNLNGCNLTAILVNGVNVSTLELNNAKSTGIHPLLNIQSNITVELVYATLVIPCTVTITTTSPLPTITQNVFYSTQLTYSSGVNPVTWSIVSGSFPTGITMSSSGLVSGTNTNGVNPTTKPTIRITDANGCTNDRLFNVNLALPACNLIVAPIPSQTLTIGQFYTYQMTYTGTSNPVSFNINSGFPNGLTLSNSGLISGTPTQSGSFNALINVFDLVNASCFATQGFYGNVESQADPCEALTLFSGANGICSPINQPITPIQSSVFGGTAPYTYSIINGGSELSVNSNGLITGTLNSFTYQRELGFGGIEGYNFGYGLVVTDLTGCTKTEAIRLSTNDITQTYINQPLDMSFNRNTPFSFTVTGNGNAFQQVMTGQAFGSAGASSFILTGSRNSMTVSGSVSSPGNYSIQYFLNHGSCQVAVSHVVTIL